MIKFHTIGQIEHKYHFEDAVVSTDTFNGACQFCPHICKCQQYSINLQIRIQLSLYLTDCFH